LPVTEKVVSQMTELANEVSMLHEASEKEAAEKQMVVLWFEEVQAHFGAQVKLSDETIKIFKGSREGHLDRNAHLVLVDAEGGTVTKPLESLTAEEFLCVTQDCTTKLLELVAKEEDAVIASKQPEFLLRISLEGSRLLIFDWRSYHLSVKNAGADSVDTRISATIEKLSQRYDSIDLGRGAETELDLRKFHGLAMEESVKVGVRCKDIDDREYAGSASVRLVGEDWQRLRLEAVRERAAPRRS